MSDMKPLNPGLFRVHRLFMVLYAVLGVLLVGLGAKGAMSSDVSAFGGLFIFGALVGALGVAHGQAMKGASLGKSYGRTLSRLFGCMWLIGFPIGTILGIYVLTKAGDKSWVPENVAPPTSQ